MLPLGGFIEWASRIVLGVTVHGCRVVCAVTRQDGRLGGFCIRVLGVVDNRALDAVIKGVDVESPISSLAGQLTRCWKSRDVGEG